MPLEQNDHEQARSASPPANHAEIDEEYVTDGDHHFQHFSSGGGRTSLTGSSGFSSSFRAMEDSAIHIQEDLTRSIGGRLGGRLSFVRDGDGDPTKSPVWAKSPAGERTLLLQKHKAAVATASPALSVWILPALLCASAYACYNVFIKKGSASINPVLGGVVLQFVAALLGSVLLGVMILRGNVKMHEIQYDRNGLVNSVYAGLAVGTAEMLSFCVSGMGVQATQFIPIIIGGSVVFGAVLGLLMLGEKLKLHGWSGILMLVSGIALVATDPGDKAQEGGGSDGQESPPLTVWIGPALICASAYAFYNVFIKKGSASINPILGGVVLQFVAAVFGSLLLGVLVIKDGGTHDLQVTRTGLFWACCAGLAVGAAEMLSFCVSGLGVQASQSIPTIIGGSVMFGAILGLIMLGETLMVQGWSGILLLMVGIGFVATDPGEKAAGH